MKKRFILLAILALNISTQAQEKKNTPSKEGKKNFNKEEARRKNNSLISNQAFSEFTNEGTPGSNTPFTVILRKKETEGSKFLFKRWENPIVIKSKQGKDQILNNANYNLEKGTFALATEETIYLLDVINYKKILFNNKVFISTYNPINKSRRYLEVIYASENIKLLKDYTLIIKETENAGGYIVSKNKYAKKSRYYYTSNKDFKEIKLKKSEILQLFGQKSSKISAFAKKEKLSFKKDKDLNQIFTYYNSLLF